MLESLLNEDNSFLTLTYEDTRIENSSTGFPTLNPTHLKNWLKRFRKEISPLKIRYYAVGEYGDQTQRPHYHVALFNYPTCRFGRTRHSRVGHKVCCAQCEMVYQTWGYGNIDLGGLSAESAAYVAGYVTKKMTSKLDHRLNGRYPEFARMSLKPGIGGDFMHDVASSLMEFNLEDRMDDVPSSLRHGSRVLPLGRYLRRRLRKFMGWQEDAPQATLDQMAEELRSLRESAFDNSRSFKSEIIQAADNKVLQMETKNRIYKRKVTL